MTPPGDNFSTLFELLPIGAYRMSPDGMLLRANAALVRMTGAKDEAELRSLVSDAWYVQPGRRAQFFALLQGDGVVSGFISEVVEQRTGIRRWISENAHIVRDANGRALYYEGTAEDITQAKEAERNLQFILNRFQALTAKSQSASVICDTEGRISYASEAVRSLFGVPPETMIGSNLFDTMHPDDQLEHRAEFARVAERKNTGEESVARHRHAEGGWRHLASFASDARDDESIQGMIVYWRDVTEAHLARARLRQIVEADALTGLYARANFERRAFNVLDRVRQIGSRAVLFFIDLDNFKLANDTYGHWIGDQILIAIARRLQKLCVYDELVARLGGDEFAMLAILDEGATSSIQIAQRIVETISAPIQVEAIRFDITASVGVALFPDHATQFTELLRFADQAMFAAKAVSRNTFCVFTSELERQGRARADLIADLKRAIENDEFDVHYQPQVELETRRLVGFEALVRWRHPTRGLIGPSEFIAIAEEQGLIDRIGDIVLDRAIEQIARWRKRSGRALRIAVNVSARQLRDRALGTRVRALLDKHEVPAECVEIEVTESILLEANTPARDLLESLKALGVRIVLDDLGVGYSSIAYLHRFSVDGVKLDRSFVGGLPSDAVDVAIVRSLITLARELNLTIVSEGVENVAQCEYLIGERCDIGQGYLFAKPLTAEVIESTGWLHEGTARWLKTG
jgi:diguanylate cyclase (GGDEF)-like protein/PAS domain S-box-containing protein